MDCFVTDNKKLLFMAYHNRVTYLITVLVTFWLYTVHWIKKAEINGISNGEGCFITLLLLTAKSILNICFCEITINIHPLLLFSTFLPFFSVAENYITSDY